ncbi:MAG TPA: NADH-quinone oxidoreductase subunit L, partial [Candidatus Polarisedimenticolia bacterium]|nr:NADH-quinone oxidoreductase subunit L [Candidatus Polarisedimenticolia bacterium]
ILLGIWILGVVTAGLTAFYMTRLYLLVFAGAPRMGEETKHHLHESPRLMTLPLVILAAGAALAGFLGVPEFLGRGLLPNYLEEFLATVVPVHHIESVVMAVPSEWAGMSVALLASIAGIAAAWAAYGRRPLQATTTEPIGLVRVVKEKFYVDEMYRAVVVRPYYAISRIAATIDERVVDGVVNAVAAATDLVSQMTRLWQTGYVRNYALFYLLGTILILMYALR